MSRSIRFLPAFGLVIAGAIVAGPPAFAVPVTYTESATASGSLGGVAFTNETITLTMHNDTANVTGGPGPFVPFTNRGTIALTVDARPAVRFTDPDMEIFVTQAVHTVGFVDETSGNDILDTTNAGLATYDLKTGIGPLTGPSLIIAGLAFPTTSGDFILSSAGPGTFAARTSTPVSEPAGVLLLALPLGLLMLLRARHA